MDSADGRRWRRDFGLSDRTFGERWCLHSADCRYGLDRYVDSDRRTHERHDVCIPCECPYRWWCWRSFVADIGGAVYKRWITDRGDGSGCRKFGGSELDCAFIRRWTRDYWLSRRAVCRRRSDVDYRDCRHSIDNYECNGQWFDERADLFIPHRCDHHRRADLAHDHRRS